MRFEDLESWKDLDVDGWESWEQSYEADLPATMAFWHDNIVLTTYYWQHLNCAVLVSKSFDGEYIARAAQRFGYGIIRGSSSRGGLSSLRKMIRLSNQGIRMTFTVDGPRGPKHKAKKGVIVLSRKIGLPIVPIMAVARKSWTLNNWDGTQIPMPFSRAKVFTSTPVFVPADADEEMIESKRLELERKLDELVSHGEEWRKAKS